ncbi:MAG: DUF5995 family protein [Marmoricola sp.]
MLLRRILGLALTASLTVSGVLLMAPAQATPARAGGIPLPIPDPLEPNPTDPVIGLLPALPVPWHPYAGPCADGSPRCIDATIRQMRRRTNRLATSCDHNAVFSLAYLRVTQNVRNAVNTGYFHDRVWLRQIDADFASKYFHTLDRWYAGDHDVPPAWKIALRAAHDGSVTGLGDFMLGMNAHINNDFAHVLAQVGLTGRNGRTHKPDHNAYNDRLDHLYHPVFREEARRFDPTFNDYDVGPADDDFAKTVMRGWREIVWRHAELLSTARTPGQRRAISHEISDYAVMQAKMIKVVFAAHGSTAKRDAWCSTHHGTGQRDVLMR